MPSFYLLSIVLFIFDFFLSFLNLDNGTYTIEAKSGFLKGNIYYEQYGHYVEEVSPLQIFGLCASLAACGILFLWSLALHRSFSKKPWKPRRGLQSSSKQGVPVTRQESGIVLGRATSGASYYIA